MSEEPQIATDDEQRDDLSSPVAESREDAIRRARNKIQKLKKIAVGKREDTINVAHRIFHNGQVDAYVQAIVLLDQMILGK